MEACSWKGQRYSASSASVAPRRAPSTSPRLTSTRVVAGARRSASCSAAAAGSRPPPRQVTTSARAAAMACSSRSQTTPTKSPWRTIWMNPGTDRAAASSTAATRAPTAWGRITRPCSMPGTRTSCT